MTSTTQTPQRHTDEEFDKEHRKSNGLIITVIVLAILLLALGGWVIYDANSSDSTDASGATTAGATAAVPAEVNQAINDYVAAWENTDPEAFLASVTDDFIINEYIYFAYTDGVRLQEVVSEDDAEYVASRAFDPDFPWIVERGEMTSITGDGPWYVSFPETWQVESNVLDGMATYMITDVDGTPKVQNHYWVGISQVIEF